MATARIITLKDIPVDAGETTHFHVQARLTGASSWTDYYATGAGPAIQDIDVADLDANNDYLIDGVNTPTGNKATVSQAGWEYRIRLKDAGGYSNYSNP